MHINDLLKIAAERRASDLHIKVGSHPVIRVDGELIPLVELKRLMQEDTIAMAFSIMSSRQKEKFKNNYEIDIAYSVPGLGRFRCNIFQQRGTVGHGAARHPGQDPLHPRADAADRPREDRRGAARSDPLHRDHRLGQVDHAGGDDRLHQRPPHRAHHDGRGPDRVPSPRQEIDRQPARSRGGHEVVLAGAASALRQDPDVILVGEMRDYETIETALTAAETGHLVLSTLHTLDATETINRIISVFPPHQQKQIRLQLAAVLKAVISLRLLPRADGLGRVPAAEVLISTAYIRDCIENKEKTKMIKDAIAQGTSQYGMQTFDQSLYHALQERSDHARRSAAPGLEPRRVQAQAPGHPVHLGHLTEEMEAQLTVPGDGDPFSDESPFDFSNSL